MAANLPIVDPTKVLSPVLMIRGTWDGNSTNEDLLDFYKRLPNGDRQFVILPETAHKPGLWEERHLLYYAVKNFLAAPAPIRGVIGSHKERPMKIVQGDEIEWVRGLEYRGGTFHYRNLMEGTAGTIDNFQLSMGRNDKDFVSPRHRHNFEQFRFPVRGRPQFRARRRDDAGHGRLFPGGHVLRPTDQRGDRDDFRAAVRRLKRPRLLSRKEVKQGMDALRATGTFDGGVYPAQRRRAWQAQHGRFPGNLGAGQRPAAAIPEAALRHAVMMDQANYEWVASPDQPGVFEKLLGMFTERRSEAGLFRLNAGATLTRSGRGLYLAYRGGGHVDGQPLRPLTTVFLERGERASFVAEQETELLHFGLPDLRGLENRPAYTAEAAE